MRSTIFYLYVLTGCDAFTSPSRPATPSRRTHIVRSTPVASADASSSSSETTTTATAAPPNPNKNKPDWEVKQHLYGLDASSGSTSVTLGADGEVAGAKDEPLPLPDTYITCGNCKSLFAISEGDLGDKGKGCRVKCTVCGNSWFQSRERLFNIPTESHDFVPANPSDLDRIARNLARDLPPAFYGVSKLYVGNLDFRTSADELLKFFEENSPKVVNEEGGEEKVVGVCDVSVVTGPDGRPRGFAFVSFYSEKDGKAALECNGMECNGRELVVNETNN